MPDIPSATVMNIAKALIGKRKIKINTTGIRPGEKMHEIMVSEEECHHTIKRGKYFAIQSMLPELRKDKKSKPVLTTEYSSADSVVSLEETRKLLDRHKLLIGQAKLAEGGELLA